MSPDALCPAAIEPAASGLVASVLLSGLHCLDGEDRSRLDVLLAMIAPQVARHALSGALVTADQRFALLVEGVAGVIEPLLAALAADGGHPAMHILSRDELIDARLPGWRVVYDGRSFFVDRAIAAAATCDDEIDRRIRIARLLTIITGLTGEAR